MIEPILLAPGWILTTEHPRSNYGIPVLIDQATGDAFGSGEVIPGGVETAAHFVAMSGKDFTSEELDACKLFLGQWPEGPQL